MSAAIRGLVGLGALSGVAGGSYLLHRQLSTDNIGKKLEANGYKLLSDNDENWTKILEHYRGRIENKKEDFKFRDFDGKTPPENTVNTLKSKCKEVLAETTGNKENYKKAEKWCTVPKSLVEILKEKGYRGLNWDTTKDEDQNEWNDKLVDYDKPDAVQEKKFNGLTLKEGSKALQKDKATRNKLKGKCKELEAKKHYEKDFETELDKSILWCAIQVKKAE